MLMLAIMQLNREYGAMSEVLHEIEDFDDGDFEAPTEIDRVPYAGPVGEMALRGIQEEKQKAYMDYLDEDTPVGADPLRVYLNGIGKIKLLTAVEEVDLAKRMEAGLYAEYKLAQAGEPGGSKLTVFERRALQVVKREGSEAKQHMLVANLRLVVNIAKRYQGRGLNMLDLIQEGNMGLIRAVEKFDYTKGFKFSTYATWWVRQAISRGIADTSRTIRIPVHLGEQVIKMNRIRRELSQELNRDPSNEEVAEAMGLSPEKVADIADVSREATSLDGLIKDDGDLSLYDLMPSRAPGPEEAALERDKEESIRTLLGVLTPRERLVIKGRYGFVDGQARTLDDIGRELGVSRERIRQLERGAMAKLRSAASNGTGLQSLLDS